MTDAWMAVADRLEELIRDEFKVGDQLPPEATLRNRLQSSLDDFRAALADLRVNGFIRTVPHRAHYVARIPEAAADAPEERSDAP